MAELLSIVDEVFTLEGRGCVIAPGVPIDSRVNVRISDPLWLKRPDGTVIDTRVAGIEILNLPEPQPHPYPILLPSEIRSDDVPIGTQVFTGGPPLPDTARQK